MTAQAKTRDEVRHELEEAIVHGEMMANGEDGRSVKEVFPGLYRGSHTDVATERGFTGHSQSLLGADWLRSLTQAVEKTGCHARIKK